MPGVRGLWHGWNQYWKPISPPSPFLKDTIRIQKGLFLHWSECVHDLGKLLLSFIKNKWSLNFKGPLRCGYYCRAHRRCTPTPPRVKKTSLWFCVPLWQSSAVDIANWKQTAETDWECPVLSVPIFPTALDRYFTSSIKGVFLNVSTEEEGLNESWHDFICTVHISNITKRNVHCANIQISHP